VLATLDGGLPTLALWAGRHLGGLAMSADLYRALFLKIWLLPLALAAMGAYPGYAVHPVRKLRQRASLMGLAVLALILDLLVWHPEALAAVPALALCGILAMLAWPLANRALENALRLRGWWGTPVAILGAGKTGRALVRALRREPAMGLIPAAFYDDRPPCPAGAVEGLPVLGSLKEAGAAAAWAPIAIVALPSRPGEELARIVSQLPFRRVLVVPDLDGIQSMWLRGTDLGGRFALDVSKRERSAHNRLLKRGGDLLLGLPIILACAPAILVLAGLVRVASPGSPFYAQVREGRDGRRIRVWKLRTMHADAQERLDQHLARSPEARAEWETHFKLKQDPRILPGIGPFLRRTSLDELPQLWNVLKGDMSLVGPRPFPHYHLDAFAEGFRQLRASVLPGMTGLWQVSARKEADLGDQERLDSFYIHNWSLWLDVDVLLRTVLVVVRGTGT
jgi:Undecaprenyl-phosphate galactose phosphotransferase WbaP